MAFTPKRNLQACSVLIFKKLLKTFNFFISVGFCRLILILDVSFVHLVNLKALGV